MKKINVYLTEKDIKNKKDLIVTYKELMKNIGVRDEINTTILEGIDSDYYKNGYDIEVFSEGKSIKFSDVLNGKHTEREIRLSHNWLKLVLNGEFDNIKVDF